jgi:ubiquinone/menaquinone biosynthesis C-methylase UbiE
VDRTVALGELWLGLEGAALLRNVIDGDDDFVAARLTAIKALVDQMGEGPFALRAPVPELDVEAGYQAWAPIYDEMSNPLIEAEEPLVDAALRDVPPGEALDAACGTGRHVGRLLSYGHRTVGVDRSRAMIDRARSKHPGVVFCYGELTALPVASASVDVATCALALTHLEDPAPGIAELARVAKPGGRVVISDAHPTFVLILGKALFPHQGAFAYVRNHAHLHGVYLRAFATAGLEVIDCAEAPMMADFTEGITAGAAEAAAALWRDVPVALVWTLTRN